MSERITAPWVRAAKGGRPIVCLTAYDVWSGELADVAGVDVVLVGDSLGNVVLGFSTTLPVTLEHMLHHTRAVRRGVKRALLVADLPFGTFQISTEEALRASVALARAGADAVKLEGDYPEAVAAILKAGVPVMGHLGMTPQSVKAFGGKRTQGAGAEGERVLAEARSLEAAGVFGIVLELVPASLATRITAEIGVPTIGIGAGAGCDGQIQVFHDVVGLAPKRYRHAKPYADGREIFTSALESYTKEVREGVFPTEENAG